MVFREIALFIADTKLYKPWGVGISVWGEYTLLTVAKVLGMLPLNGEEFQVLAGHILIRKIRREEAYPVIPLPGYFRGDRGGSQKALCTGTCSPTAGSNPSPA